MHPRISPDCKYIVSRWNKLARVTRIENGELKLDVELKHDHDINTMNFSNDGKYLVVGDGSSSIRIWDWEKRSIIKDIKGSTIGKMNDYLVEPAFTNDNKFLAVRWEKSCLLYNLENGEKVMEFKAADSVHYMK